MKSLRKFYMLCQDEKIKKNFSKVFGYIFLYIGFIIIFSIFLDVRLHGCTPIGFFVFLLPFTVLCFSFYVIINHSVIRSHIDTPTLVAFETLLIVSICLGFLI